VIERFEYGYADILFGKYYPSSSIGENEKSSVSAIVSISFPCSALRNSPLWLSSFRAFHSLGLWLAVMMIAGGCSFVTAISVVG